MIEFLNRLSFLYLLCNHMEAEAQDLTNVTACDQITIKDQCPNSNVTFWLYNQNVQDYQLIEGNMSTFTNAPFTKGVKTVVILHGYTKSKSQEPNIWLRPQYMTKGYNIISADYSNVVPPPCYVQAVANSDTIAKCVAHFIVTLLINTTVTLEKLLVIGFSLGGQVGGRAGKYLQEINSTLPYLVGLDVAGPLYYGPLTYIDKSCANFVQIIHTNALLFGKLEFVGHIDFVVNEGLVQSLCTERIPNIYDIVDFMQCSHDMAPQYYAESITSNKTFCGRSLLKKPVVMGEYTPVESNGNYSVTTNMNPPYAKDDVCQ